MGPSMPPIPGPFVKITYFAADDIYGDSISIVAGRKTGVLNSPPQVMIDTVGGRLNKMFGNSASTAVGAPSKGNGRLTFERYSPLAQRRQSEIVDISQVGYYTSSVWTPTVGTFAECGSNQFVNGLAIRMRSSEPGTNTLSDTTLWIPSIPDPCAKSGSYNGTNVSNSVGNYDANLLNLLQVLISNQPNYGGWVWGHMGVVKPTVYTALGAAVSASGQWVIAYIDVPTFVAGDVITIRKANAPNWNSNYRVSAIDTVGKTITLAKGPPKSQIGFTSAQCILYRTKGGVYNQSFYAYIPRVDNASVANILSGAPKLSSHRPARKFTGVSFRRKKRVARSAL
jgi:hypothetical protein